ncbi:MAG: AlpA family phage regulatory protein [Natronohydrobacter sp.]|nr:AlpA family phage regulatory protein [Natronohydrobacter sp.]
MDRAQHQIDHSGPITDRLITISMAHQKLGVSRSKLYRMLEENEIPRPVKIGRRAYFSERELQMWIADRLAARPGSANATEKMPVSRELNGEVRK